ncbi:MAG: PIG-L deacetylase family protein [Anaerolineae bacterium]|nr:PIG-L family deacetylase [Thermoflexales bacterium]MDW8396562.1 PIG-L deacetylase family protein [Anaerolineae bacterium]
MHNDFVPRSAMVVAAHPDDIEFGCAGTCAKWARRGAHIVYVLVTSGNTGTHDRNHTRQTLAELREAEQRQAAAICGVNTIEFLRYDDGEVVPSLELRKALIALIRKHRPEVVIALDPRPVFIGDEYINHPDHRAVAIATMDAVFPAAAMPLLYPELGEPHRVREVWVQWVEDPNTWVDISETLEVKIQALLAHKSQVGQEVAERIRARAYEAGRGLVPAEAFKVIKLYRRHFEQEEAAPAANAAQANASA